MPGDRLQHQEIRFWRHGQLGVEVPDEEARLFVTQFELLVLERLRVSAAENGQQHPVPCDRARGMPIDVKKRSVGGAGAVFQHVHPPGILAPRHQVVRNDVQNQTHMASLEFRGQRFEFLLAANLGIEVGRIRDVVTVPASPPSLKQRRRVDIGHTEFVEITRQRSRVLEAKLRAELQAVG